MSGDGDPGPPGPPASGPAGTDALDSDVLGSDVLGSGAAGSGAAGSGAAGSGEPGLDVWGPSASGPDPWASIPASGAWRPGDDPGNRRFVHLFVDAPLTLEAGGAIGPITVAYETWGQRRSDGENSVLVLPALTADSHLSGPATNAHPSPGWWNPIVAAGGALDASTWWTVCPNVLGGCQGTTGPSSAHPDGRPWGSRWPTLTVRDQVAVEMALSDALGVDRWALVVGGSMGGMRALEWAVGAPDRVARGAVIACGAAATAEQIALSVVQAGAIRLDPGFAGGDYYSRAPGEGPGRGLGLARRLGHITYRSETELDRRFGRRAQAGEDPLVDGRYAVESYLDHHALKLAARFDANSYLTLTRAMDHHDIGRGRGGVAAALARVTARMTVAGVDRDRLYPLRLQAELAETLPGRPRLRVIESAAGHDGFLIEADQIDKIVTDALS